jgi:hypothetical protein
MNVPTLDRVLTDAEHLSLEDQEILEGLLRKRRIEAWREETAADAKKVVSNFQSGKLKAQSADRHCPAPCAQMSHDY